MPYQSLTSIADDIVEMIEDTNAFRSVSWVALDNYRQLMDYAKTIAVTPKAVVCIGSGNYDKSAMIRTFTVAVVVFAAYLRTRQSRADAVWSLAEAAAQPFIPVVSTAAAPVFKSYNGVHYEPKGWAPLETDDLTASFVLEIAATEIIKYPLVVEEE